MADELDDAITNLQKAKVAEAKRLALENYNQGGPEVFGYQIPVSDIKGYARAIGSGPTFGYFDEISAGLNALMGRGDYEDLLAREQGEQLAFKEQNPYVGTGTEIASAVALNPLAKLKLARLAAGTAGKVALAGLQGAGEGALSGIGNTNLGESKVLGAITGGGLGGLFGAGGQALSSGAKASASQSDKYLLNSYNTPIQAINESYEEMGKRGLASGEELPIISIIKKMEDKGIMKAGQDPNLMAKKLVEAQDEVGAKITPLLKKVDDVVPPTVKDLVVDNTDELLRKNPTLTGEQMMEHYTNQMNAITKNFKDGGSLEELQKAKIGLNASYEKGDAYKAQIDRAIRQDLKETIENRVNSAAQKGLIDSDNFGKVRELNKEWGEYEDIYGILSRVAPREAKKTATEKFLDMAKTTGGVGTPALIASYLGSPALGGVVGTGAYLARTPTGQRFLSSLTGKGEAIGNFIESLPSTGNLAGALSVADREQGVDPLARITLLMERNKQSLAESGASEGDPFARIQGLFEANKKSLGNSDSTYLGNISPDMSKKKLNSGGNVKVPKELEGLINKTALDEGLEPRLLQSLIKQESGFNPTATSSVGAKGLMQLMPATAKELATNAGLDNYDLFDPETNLRLGARYYRQLRDEFNGDDALALTAYHSGIGRVKKLLAKNEGTGLDDIIGDLGTVGQKYAKSILSRV